MFQKTTTIVVGRDVAPSYTPEREDSGSSRFGLANTPKLGAGYTAICREPSECLYRPVVEKLVSVSSPRAAEAAKPLSSATRGWW